MTVTNRKSKGKAKAPSSNVVGIFIRETEKDVASLTCSGEEESAFATNTGAPLTSKTQSSRPYLKQYGDPIVDSSQPAEEAIKQSTRPSVEKQKELWYVTALQKGGMGPSTPFHFDVMTQLANIPAWITFYLALKAFQVYKGYLERSVSICRGFRDLDSCYMHRERWKPMPTPQSNFPTSPSPQKTCKSKENMINPRITQGTLDYLK